ncbi:MAG: RNA 2',3'-cyclic phosphodiesterase [Candidatus Neomarinimicrobiota bacterium]
MPERLLRTFISVAVPSRIGTVCDMLRTTIPASEKAIRWTKMNSIHLTLKFIGPTPADLIPEINRRLRQAVSGIEAMSLAVAGTGCFPDPRRPRVIWLGMTGELDRLHDLATKVHNCVVDLGIPDESAAFKPHITIARIKYPQKRTPDISAILRTEYQPVALTTDRIHLISSELLPGGPVYSNLGTHYFALQLQQE